LVGGPLREADDMEIDALIRKKAEDAAADAVRRAAKAAVSDGQLQPEYLDTREAAIYLGLSTQYLEIGRHRGYGPRYHKMAKAVRYRRADLDHWMSQYCVSPPGGKSAA
jgi:hypothetical protein